MAITSRALPGRRRFPPPVSVPQLIILALVFVGMVLLGNYVARRLIGTGVEEAPTYQTGTASRRTIESTVSATGSVSAVEQARLNFATTGTVREVLVNQGDQVQAGQMLATLNPSSLEIKRDQARTNLTTAQLKLEALLAGPTDADVAAAQQTVASAQSTLTTAQNNLFNLLEGSSADEIAQAQAALERAQVNLNVAQSGWDKLANGVDLNLRPEYTTLQTAKANYETAQSNYTTKTAPPNSFDVANAQATLTSAQSSLDSARAKLNQVLAGSDPLDIANARNTVTSAEAALTAAKAKLEDLQNPTTTVTAVEIAALEAAVDAARQNLNAAKVAQTDALFDGTAPSRAEAEARVKTAESQLATAQSNLAKVQQTTSPTSSEVLTAQQNVASAQTTLDNARNNLNKLLQGPSAADIAAAQQGVAAAESQVQTAQNNLDKLLAGPTPADVAAAQATLDNARSALEVAQTNWDRLANGVDLESRTEYTQLMSARADYQTALTTYNTLLQGPKPGDVAAAQSSVDAANASLNSALVKLTDVQDGALPTDIGQQREAVANAELALKQAQTDLDNATLKAPFTGTVVSVGIKPGDQVGASTIAFTLLDPGLLRIDATVDESNVSKIKAGMPVNVTFDSLPGQTFQGVVASVTPSGTSSQGVVTFPVTVVFNTQGYTIPPGTTANLSIVTEGRPNVLAVPSRAVTRQGTQSVVQVLENGEPVTRPVQTGITGSNFTEILSGLSDGEQIVISTTGTTGQQSSGALGTGGLGTSGGGPLPGGGAPVIIGPRGGG